jgi:hypothetical protein
MVSSVVLKQDQQCLSAVVHTFVFNATWCCRAGQTLKPRQGMSPGLQANMRDRNLCGTTVVLYLC